MRTHVTSENNLARLTHSIREGAEMLGVSPMTIQRRIRSGAIKTIRFGRRRLIPADEIAAIMNRGAL